MVDLRFTTVKTTFPWQLGANRRLHSNAQSTKLSGKVMDPCKEREPGVINNDLLEKCIKQQFPPGEAGRLALEEGIPLQEIEHLRLEHLNILRIDHLWMMKSLTKLSLSQNYIEQIENLHDLIHLRELDLSFNKIGRIENLDKLVNLEILSFFDNRIIVLENMDTLTKLTIFSIGRNYIEDKENIIYLRRFKELKSVNLAGNPCAEQEEFRTYVAVMLPHVSYYEYKMITDEEKERGLEMFRYEVRHIEQIEQREREIQEKKEAEEAEALRHSDSFVEYLGSDHLFRSLFENDEEGKALFVIGDEIMEYYTEFEEQFVKVCKQLFQFGQEQYALRKVEVDQYLESAEGAKTESQQQSIQNMEEFLQNKAAIFLEVRKHQEEVDNNDLTLDEYSDVIDVLSEEFSQLIHQTWKVLMKIEMTLYEQLEEAVQTFDHTLTEMVNTFVENAQGYFTQMRSLEQTYLENIAEVANRYLTNLNIHKDAVCPEELVEIMTDKESLNNALDATHDTHLQLIDNREDRLVHRAKEWLEKTATNLQKEEIMRNRAKVLEINHFLDIQREEFEELQDVMLGPPVDADVSGLV